MCLSNITRSNNLYYHTIMALMVEVSWCCNDVNELSGVVFVCFDVLCSLFICSSQNPHVIDPMTRFTKVYNRSFLTTLHPSLAQPILRLNFCRSTLTNLSLRCCTQHQLNWFLEWIFVGLLQQTFADVLYLSKVKPIPGLNFHRYTLTDLSS